jgi:GNAT superfamily N-acetyltransferase
MQPSTASPTIVPVAPEDKPTALKLVFAFLDPKERDEQVDNILFTPLSGGNSATGLLGAYREDNLVGAIYAHIQPGGTAQVWLPRLVPGESGDTAVCLIQASNAQLQQENVELAQMLFAELSESDEELLLRGGYSYLTDLLYLACLPQDFPATEPRFSLSFLPYEATRREGLKRIIDATYRNSLDCPRLNDVRDLENIVQGYHASGVFRPELWSIVQSDGRDAGCLLLTDHPEYDNVELAYMGVIPAMRGRTFGIEIARFAQWQTRRLGRARLVLAVDAANRPAIDMYSAVGFQAWDRRRVYFRQCTT